MTHSYFKGVIPIFLFFFLVFFQTKAQEVKILHGQILTDSLSPNNIHIVNLSLKKGTTSKSSGEFDIPVRVNDSILFSSIQFQNKTIRIKEEMINSGRMEIKLYPANNELAEVQISDLNLSGVLSEDVSKLRIFERQKFGIPYAVEPISQTERQLYTATHSAGGIPLDLLLNTLNGKIKMLKKVKANDDLAANVEKGMNIVGIEFFIKEFGLKENEVENFVYFCARDPKFEELLKSGNNLGQIEFYKSKIEDFINLRQLNESSKN